MNFSILFGILLIARFVMFIHQGPVSMKGTEIGWSRAEKSRSKNTITFINSSIL